MDYRYSAQALYSLDDGDFAFVFSGAGAVREDDSADLGPAVGTVNGVLEVGEETLDHPDGNSVFDNDEIFVGTVTVDGVELIVTQTANWHYVFVPEGVDPNSLNFPDNFSDLNLIESDTTICFAAGTLIAGSDGERLVETLQIGDIITTASGRDVAVKWVGRQTLHKRFLGARMQMVRIRAGALGQGLPHSDLTVTADHGMVISGCVVNASALVNGETIVYVPLRNLAESFTVYHIETEEHDVILANGAPSETFVDYVTRANFDNFQEYAELYGAEHVVPEMTMPRVSSSRLLPTAIKDHLGRRSITDTPSEIPPNALSRRLDTGFYTEGSAAPLTGP